MHQTHKQTVKTLNRRIIIKQIRYNYIKIGLENRMDNARCVKQKRVSIMYGYPFLLRKYKSKTMDFEAQCLDWH